MDASKSMEILVTEPGGYRLVLGEQLLDVVSDANDDDGCRDLLV